MPNTKHAKAKLFKTRDGGLTLRHVKAFDMLHVKGRQNTMFLLDMTFKMTLSFMIIAET